MLLALAHAALGVSVEAREEGRPALAQRPGATSHFNTYNTHAQHENIHGREDL